MVSFLVVLKFAAQITHPVDVELARPHIESPWGVALSERLALEEALKDSVHGNLSFESLVGRANTLNEVFSEARFAVAVPVSRLNRSLVLEGTAC